MIVSDCVILCFAIFAFYFLNSLCVRFKGFDYKVMIFLKILFGLGAKLETYQASQYRHPLVHLICFEGQKMDGG